MNYMERALLLGRRALGTTSPNPSVGAVIVKDGQIVSEGWTQPPGQQHAEAMAVQKAGPLAKGATLYVSLEPCNHIGRTPPCTEAIIEAGIIEVHIATADPNPKVRGGGLDRLNEAGIQTHLGEQERPAQQLIEAFTKHCKTGIPFVTAKFAMSLDGKIATRTGDSKWITGPESRRYVHQLRAESDAILAGINTVLADDPQLTARNESGNPLAKQPLRVIVDSNFRIPTEAKLLSEPGSTLVVTSNSKANSPERLPSGVEVANLPAPDGLVSMEALLGLLGKREFTSLFVEGGGTILGSLFDSGLVDKVVAFVAPVIIGGRDASSPIEGKGIEKMADALRLKDVDIRQFGNDVAIIGYCK